ncbi:MULTISPECIES: AMIN-like domain-containing (lipo)protein [unclassified Rhodococcus (in: high G+C Gram-positive bacteria)]|uniref:AMIN-like domain-containing (lipo)protein n=1 Tax=unclassified Rhodococcus (in: high G+C Gram-positive bacteria) TaxID=192944 RepID=UPI001FF65B68|nr:hypothetical protein [Rhodococcus sp. F64268]MCK0089935.1 hypothetical protein [Rhodococcus sp. F64268]HET8994860.1 hypothetical protein [Rhodococcus sp. (in: high G+C Gram-positive bacteria)]
MLRTRHALAVTAAALVLAGCTANGDPAPEPAVSIETEVDAPDAPSTIPTDTADKISPAGDGAKLTVTDIRTGRHEGFDRVVYEMGGQGTPGWRVGYVDQAVQDGSGNEIPLAGSAVIQVLIDGSAYPFDSGVEPYSGPNPVLGPSGGSVVEVNGSGVFEGVTQSFIGVAAADTPFSVTALTEPTRLVIDVAN